MSDFNNRLESKLDRLDERLDRIDVTLAAQHVSLAEHIRRTQILENHMEPVRTHVTMVKGVAKAIGLLALGGGIAQGVASILELLKH